MNQTTLNPLHATHFTPHAHKWWDPQGPLKPLHLMNPTRLAFIVNQIKGGKGGALNGLKILDIGCGAGLITEPLARLGAEITGIDASKELIEVAKNHAKGQGLDIDYQAILPENFKPDQAFDVVLALELLEHIDHPLTVFHAIHHWLVPEGKAFFSTLNKTLKSYFYGILIAEHVLKWVPKGTHDWQKFIPPKQLIHYLEQSNFHPVEMKGMHYRLDQNRFYLSDDLSMNYICCAKKNSIPG